MTLQQMHEDIRDRTTAGNELVFRLLCARNGTWRAAWRAGRDGPQWTGGGATAKAAIDAAFKAATEGEPK